jgi:hypothetical protein
MATVPYGDSFTTRPAQGAKRKWWKLAAAAVVGGAGAWWGLTPAPQIEEAGVAAVVVHHETPAAMAQEVRGAEAIRRCRDALLAAQKKLEASPAMTAVFQKQERIDGKLQPLNVMDVKVRREPLAVYMKWQKPDAGQELIWREGAFDGQILVSPAGWRRKVMPMVKIDPFGDMAMATSKRPITNMGIWNFTNRLLGSLDGDLTRDPSVDVVMTTGDEISGRVCDRYQFELARPSKLAGFQKFIIFVDRTLGVPVACECYRWDEEAKTPTIHLEESYAFRDLNLQAPLTDADFDHANPAYLFTAK